MGLAQQLYALTCPLLTTASGAKMGKTAAGAVWLNETQLSAYDYWQYWRNTEDADVGRFLKLYTTLPMTEMAKLERLAGSEINEAKKVLATEATALVHGRDKAQAAADTARQTFEQGELSEGLPTHFVQRDRVEEGIGLQTLFVEAGMATSNSEVRRLISNNSIWINDDKISDAGHKVTAADFKNGTLKISTSKKKHMLIRLS